MASSDVKTERLEREIHDIISKLTDRLARLGHGTSEHDDTNHHHPNNGMKIITLAGKNKGAAMKTASLDDLVDTEGKIFSDANTMSAYTNSNYQAVNNSIMLEGSCSADDPGVHIVISEHVGDGSSSDGSDSSDGEDQKEQKKKKNKEKKEKKEKHSEDEEESKTKHSD